MKNKKHLLTFGEVEQLARWKIFQRNNRRSHGASAGVELLLWLLAIGVMVLLAHGLLG